MNQWDGTSFLRALGRQELVSNQGCEGSAGAANEMEVENRRSDKESELRLRSCSMCTLDGSTSMSLPAVWSALQGPVPSSSTTYKKRMGQHFPLAWGTSGCVCGGVSVWSIGLCSPLCQAQDGNASPELMQGTEFSCMSWTLMKGIRYNNKQSTVTVSSDSVRWFPFIWPHVLLFLQVFLFWTMHLCYIVVQFEHKFFLTNIRPKKRLTATSPFWGKKPDWTV